MRSALALVALCLFGCADDVALPRDPDDDSPASLRALVEVVADIGPGVPVAVPECSTILLGHAALDLDGVTIHETRVGAVGTAGRIIGGIPGKGQTDLIVASDIGEIRIQRHCACRWDAAFEQVTLPLQGTGSSTAIDYDRILVGWSEGPRVLRSIAWAAGSWYEEKIEEPKSLRLRRTRFVRAWGGRLLFGLDAGESFALPPLPDEAGWKLAGPRGASEITIAGARMLFVGGAPQRSMLLDEAGVDHATAANLRGPAGLVTWESRAIDLNRDGLDDLIALSLTTEVGERGPAPPRVLMQRNGGRFSAIPVDGPPLVATRLACIGATCAATSETEGVLIRVTVR